MSAFTADWLELRAPADTTARSRQLTDALINLCTSKNSLRIVDLCAGSGANMRYLAPRFRQKQHWLLLDNDRTLLARAVSSPGDPDLISCESQCCDLARTLDRLDLSGVDIVTASATMDLVSADWFDRLAERCLGARSVLLFVLSYDGRIIFDPVDSLDTAVRDLFNRHQVTDKGFGPALGPTAPRYMVDRLQALGYRVETATSDWCLGEDQAGLQDAVIAGYADAASENAPEESSEIGDWRRRRLTALAAGRARLVVGHVDLLAYP